LGKLRIEPKKKPPVNREEYSFYRKLLAEARSVSDGNNIYYDLEKSEKPGKVRGAILYVAALEGIDVVVRVNRKQNNLSLDFRDATATADVASSLAARISPAKARDRIVRALKARKGPRSKGEILAESRVSPTIWNLRVNELMDEGKICRHGRGPNTSYSIKDN
jgi:hypothetical protein